MSDDSSDDGHDLCQVVFDGNDAASKLTEKSSHRRVHKYGDSEFSWDNVSFSPRVRVLKYSFIYTHML